jgi:hypothetical protein
VKVPDEAPPAHEFIAVLGHKGSVAGTPALVGAQNLVNHAVGIEALAKGPLEDFEHPSDEVGVRNHDF